MEEKRADQRFNVCLDVRTQEFGSRYNLRMSDISEGGCYVDSILQVSKGQPLILTLILPEGEWLAVHGVVAHHFPALGFGIRFTNLDEGQRLRIRSLILETGGTLESPRSSVEQISDRVIASQNGAGVSRPFEQVGLTPHQVM